MINKLFKLFSKKKPHPEKPNIEVSFTDVAILNNINDMTTDLCLIRLEMLYQYNELFTIIEDTYLTLLANQKDEALKTMMTESWFKRSADLCENLNEQNIIITNIKNLEIKLQSAKSQKRNDIL